jgi:4-hydroxy-tetrahydrodipicolinate synthase
MKGGMVLAGVLEQGFVRPPTEPPNAREMEALRAAVAQAGLAAR